MKEEEDKQLIIHSSSTDRSPVWAEKARDCWSLIFSRLSTGISMHLYIVNKRIREYIIK